MNETGQKYAKGRIIIRITIRIIANQFNKINITTPEGTYYCSSHTPMGVHFTLKRKSISKYTLP
jgi:hypothetical protein